MKEIGGFYWPDGDTVTPDVVLREVNRLPRYLEHVPTDKRRACVQAGGNVGVYATWLAHFFKEVFTAEPDPQNFECLQANNRRNTRFPYHVFPHALGNQDGRVETWRTDRENSNYGATRIRPSTDPAAVFLSKLDNLLAARPSQIDFLMLDVEGYEQAALEGSEEIIESSHPVISLELKGLGEPHGWPDAYTRNWLHERGYRKVERIGNDDIFVWTPSFAS